MNLKIDHQCLIASEIIIDVLFNITGCRNQKCFEENAFSRILQKSLENLEAKTSIKILKSYQKLINLSDVSKYHPKARDSRFNQTLTIEYKLDIKQYKAIQAFCHLKNFEEALICLEFMYYLRNIIISKAKNYDELIVQSINHSLKMPVSQNQEK